MVDRRNILLGGGAAALVAGAAVYARLSGMGTMAHFDEASAAIRAELPPTPEASDLIRFATLAANGHNTQPWRFRVAENRIEILPDLSRRTPAVDPDDHHLFASLGCAAENLAIAAGARGRTSELAFDAAGEGSVQVFFTNGQANDAGLFDAIPERQSTRADYDGKPVTAADLGVLEATARVSGVDLILITDRPQIDQVRDLVLAGNSAQLADPAFLRELKSWLRFSPNEAMRTGDGLFSAASGNPALPEWLGPSLFDWVFKADAENERYARQIASSAGIAVFVAQHEDPEHWVLAGRACQRFALQATALSLRHAFINQPVEVASLRSELAALAGMPGRRPDLVMRFGHGPTLPYSARRPVENVIIA